MAFLAMRVLHLTATHQSDSSKKANIIPKSKTSRATKGPKPHWSRVDVHAFAHEFIKKIQPD